MQLGATAQHPARKEGVVGVGLESDDSVGNHRERIGEEPLIGAYVNGGAAMRYELGQDSELRLARACFLRDTPPVEPRWRHQHCKSFAEGQRHWHPLSRVFPHALRLSCGSFGSKPEVVRLSKSIPVHAYKADSGGSCPSHEPLL